MLWAIWYSYYELFKALISSSYFSNNTTLIILQSKLVAILQTVVDLQFLIFSYLNGIISQEVYLDFVKILNSSRDYIYVILPENKSLTYSFKFVTSILFLIFIRAGIPRYRYDFLTKLGWLKFFLYTVLFLVLTLAVFVLF